MIEAEAWVVDGNYGTVRDRVWQRATHLVWLAICGRPCDPAILRANVVFPAPEVPTTTMRIGPLRAIERRRLIDRLAV